MGDGPGRVEGLGWPVAFGRGGECAVRQCSVSLVASGPQERSTLGSLHTPISSAAAVAIPTASTSLPSSMNTVSQARGGCGGRLTKGEDDAHPPSMSVPQLAHACTSNLEILTPTVTLSCLLTPLQKASRPHRLPRRVGLKKRCANVRARSRQSFTADFLAQNRATTSTGQQSHASKSCM